MKTVAAGFCGFIFALGLMVSGMADPANVLGFLDVTGAWNPLLAFVMGGAVAVTLPGFWWLRHRQVTGPASDKAQHWPKRWPPDVALVVGAILFGIGWGLTGVCPGPALVLLGLDGWKAWLLVAGILLGWKGTQYLQTARAR
ncbi:DUF6691 family protein [Acetobacter persici]|uniref:DUF6691 family protein n=1 Tax=Acetobacter persici TaxID=1076596 RepID=UPI001F365D45|nr:DUF6691 family protein [Acetobacter persici]MCG0999085.1 YeeE/YedE family protein [Acetobacter persici]